MRNLFSFAAALLLFATTTTAQESPKTATIMGVGDLMLGTHYPSRSYLPPNDGKDLLAPVTPLLSSADVAFGNLEGVILSGEGQRKNCNDPKVCYAFKMPDHYAAYFKLAGFDVLSMANNHVRDFGASGTENTQKLLREQGIAHAGLLQIPTAVFERNGLTYGFAAFAPNSGTVRITDLDEAQRIVRELDAQCDIVIVSFHGGAEGSTKNHITRATEIFLGENRGNPYAFSRAVIDAGADIVFGHGPHVVRALDLYKDRIIAYSLGNFATYGRFNLSGRNGYAPILEVEVTADGRFISGKIHSFEQVGEGGPTPDPPGKARAEIARLTKEDLPECNLIIGEDGSIQIAQ